MRRFFLVDIALIFLIAFLLRLPAVFAAYYSIDELTNSIFADLISSGELGLGYFLGSSSTAIHYLYVFLFKLTHPYNLQIVHLVHALWIGLTAVILYWAGFYLTATRRGAITAGVCYALFSITFVSREFYSPQPESFAHVFASLACLTFFYSIRRHLLYAFFLTGVFVGIAALFKITTGIMIGAVWIGFLINRRKSVVAIGMSMLGLGLALSIPAWFYGDIVEALRLYAGRIFDDRASYVGSYQNLTFYYWFTKFLIRTALVAAAALPLWYFAFQAIGKGIFHFRQMGREERALIWFLITYFGLALGAVAIGKRLFFHYYLLPLPALCLLAANAISKYSSFASISEVKRFLFSKRHRWVTLCALIAIPGFFVDGAARFSVRHRQISTAVTEIKKHTDASDYMYVWGLLPHLYFFSERKPASTMIWADFLAGFTPGSSAMEYMAATKHSLGMIESIKMDLKAGPEFRLPYQPIRDAELATISEHELFSLDEIVAQTDSWRWKQVMTEFKKTPPILILDTTPSGIRGFSHYPIRNYEPLKRWVEAHYTYLGIVDDIAFYKWVEN